jgi:uncharacterized protein with GYD domain
MKYVLLGTLNPEWIGRGERIERAKARLAELSIDILSIHYTQGRYDFVDLVEAESPQSVLAFSAWYGAQGYGSISSMPAFTPEEFEDALRRLS